MIPQAILKRMVQKSITINGLRKDSRDRYRDCGRTLGSIRHRSKEMSIRMLTGFLVGLAMMSMTSVVQAGSDLDKAIEAGAKHLTADEIAERLTGKTVTFVSAKSGDKYLVYYGHDNETKGRKVGDESTGTGFHAVTDRNQICLGWEGRDLPRLRCVDVLLIDGVLHKFKADGSLSGRIVEIADGNTV